MTPFSDDPEDTIPRPTERSIEPRETTESASMENDETKSKESAPKSKARERGTLQPMPRRQPDRRLDADPGDPEGTHVCAPTDV